MRCCLRAGADLHARAETGYTALMVAANYGGTGKTVRLLLERGAKVRADNEEKPPLFNASPLRLAVSVGERENVEQLYQRDPDLKQDMVVTGAPTAPLGFALFNDVPEMVATWRRAAPI